MESSPLARAEWMRFYGMLYGREREADSLFAVVDSSYHALCQQAKEAGKGRSVLVDKQTGSVWYVPGGRSTIGQMIQDANARYPWASDAHSGSVSLPFEAVIEKAGEADIWLFRYSGQHDITADELLGEHHGYDHFRAFKNHNAFGCDVERSQFYEESPFHPDWLLNDLTSILHPDLTDLEPLRYYRRIIFP
jgi:iron complex transport system substrate-binding protein